jgi:hypothetical protein
MRKTVFVRDLVQYYKRLLRLYELTSFLLYVFSATRHIRAVTTAPIIVTWAV